MADQVHSLEINDKVKSSPIIVPEEPIGDANHIVDVHAGDASRMSDSLNYGIQYDISYISDRDLINQYRELSHSGYVDYAIQDVCNEAIILDGKEPPLRLNVENLKSQGISKNISTKLSDAFLEVLSILDFNRTGEELFRKWYIDGRMYAYVFVDTKDLKSKKGIQEIRIMDPRYTRKIHYVGRDINGHESSRETFYLYYNPDKQSKLGIKQQAIKIPEDSIIYIDSGLYDNDGNALSYLHKSLIPANQLNDMEESMIIYRLARAPERRIFYIDVGELPKTAAETYMQNAMKKYKNKMTYDVRTGKMTDSRHIKSILEDVWLSRRNGSRGTEVDTLPGAQSLGQIEDIELIKTKLYRSLSIPASRLSEDPSFSLGNPGEISQDEYKFTRLVTKLRNRFTQLLSGLFRTQVVLTGVMTSSEFDRIANHLDFVFAKDTMFAELKHIEILNNRIQLASNMMDLDEIFPKSYIYKEALQLTDDEIKDIELQFVEQLKDNPEES